MTYEKYDKVVIFHGKIIKFRMFLGFLYREMRRKFVGIMNANTFAPGITMEKLL